MPDATESPQQQAANLARQETPTAKGVIAAVEQLQQADDFTGARELLDQVRPRLAADPLHVRLAQLHALSTYKDANLPADKRHRRALAILAEVGLGSADCRDKETLGQGGAIHKRMWETTGLLEHLHTALAFYRAAWERDPEHDLGWGGVNAAYLLDLLAFRERAAAKRAGGNLPTQADAWQAQARALRQTLLQRLPDLMAAAGVAGDYWNLATLAEVAFGLADYDRAGEYLARARATQPGNWQQQSTARQLVGLARLQHIPPPAATETVEQWHPAWRALHRLLGDDTAAALAGWRGKVGLALSGGGFRAALFHLGVLARLAECDILRSVETLSTVSGGSILGAQYYLELRQLLQEKPDATVSREDYVALVRRLMETTLAGIQQNLRVRVLASFWHNLKMTLLPGYSRSMRLGELYERHLFRQVRDGQPDHQRRRLADLRIFPATGATATGTGAAAADFKPRRGNWRRLAKVPNLMLNSTALNSGHNWHFTARWMGEPPGLTGDEIDMNQRYRRLYYDQAPTEALRNYPLAYAVAASSCVPALFEPLPLRDLYPGRTVRLVDGGVHDNQGMGGLLDDQCNFILCSDASGQMESQADPANGMLGVFWRSDSIFQDRMRQAQYRDIRARAEGGAVQGLFFIHMKQDLETAPIDWNGCQTPHYQPPLATCTDYGVDREIQGLLAEIRTDLDSFTEVEAYALMASGYLMTTHQLRQLDQEHRAAGLPGTWGGFDVAAPQRIGTAAEAWPFAPIVPLMGLPPGSSDLRRQDLVVQLKAGSVMFLRVWQLVTWLRHLAQGAGVAALVAGVCWVVRHWGDAYYWIAGLKVDKLTLTVGLLLATMAFPLLKYLDIRRAGQNLLLTAGVAVAGWAASWVHLAVFEPLLQARGRLARLLRLTA